MTTQDTLEKCGYFSRMFDGTMTQGLKRNGRVFIDRDGAYFSYVLDYLRSGYTPQPGDLSKFRLEKVNLEFEFFGLPKLTKKQPKRKRKRDEDELKPVWYDAIFKKIQLGMLIGGTDCIQIGFDMRDPKSKFAVSELKVRARRESIAKIIKNDLIREEDQIREKTTNKEWLLEQIKTNDPNFSYNGESVDKLREKLNNIFEAIDWIDLDPRKTKTETFYVPYLVGDSEFPRLKHVVLTTPEKCDNGHPCPGFPRFRNYEIQAMDVLITRD